VPIIDALATAMGLQFGHDTQVMENRLRRRWGPRRAGRFNSATTRRSWRTFLMDGQGTGAVALQFGHDTQVMENRDSRSGSMVGGPASIRPRHAGHGERRGPPGTPTTPPRFNSATTRRSWRTPVARRPRRVHDASIRPRHAGHGELIWGDAALALVRLQFGHDTQVMENTSRTPPTSSVRPRFNSATTRRSWRTAREAAGDAQEAGASIRPRHAGHGELKSY